MSEISRQEFQRRRQASEQMQPGSAALILLHQK